MNESIVKTAISRAMSNHYGTLNRIWGNFNRAGRRMASNFGGGLQSPFLVRRGIGNIGPKPGYDAQGNYTGGFSSPSMRYLKKPQARYYQTAYNKAPKDLWLDWNDYYTNVKGFHPDFAQKYIDQSLSWMRDQGFLTDEQWEGLGPYMNIKSSSDKIRFHLRKSAEVNPFNPEEAARRFGSARSEGHKKTREWMRRQIQKKRQGQYSGGYQRRPATDRTSPSAHDPIVDLIQKRPNTLQSRRWQARLLGRYADPQKSVSPAQASWVEERLRRISPEIRELERKVEGTEDVMEELRLLRRALDRQQRRNKAQRARLGLPSKSGLTPEEIREIDQRVRREMGVL